MNWENMFSVWKNGTLKPLGIFCILQNFWEQERPWCLYLNMSITCSRKIAYFKWNNFTWIFIFLRIFLNLNLPLMKIDWSFFSVLIFLMTYLSYVFLLNIFVLTIIDKDKEETKNQFFKYFWKILLSFEKKFLHIHK